MSTKRVKEFKKEIFKQVDVSARHALAKLRAVEHQNCKHGVFIAAPCLGCFEELGEAEYRNSRIKLIHDLLRENGLERAIEKVNSGKSKAR